MESLPGVYSLDIEQGNIINQDMVDQLRPNMGKRQVLYILGSPMLIDQFHPQRWDYLYSKQPSGKARKQKRISLFFEGNQLVSIQGDFRPSTLPAVRKSNETTVDVPPRDLEKTLWEILTGLFENEPVISTSPTKAVSHNLLPKN